MKAEALLPLPPPDEGGTIVPMAQADVTTVTVAGVTVARRRIDPHRPPPAPRPAELSGVELHRQAVDRLKVVRSELAKLQQEEKILAGMVDG